MSVSTRCVLSMAVLAVASSAAAQNQVVNPGFTGGFTGWTLPANPAYASVHDATQGWVAPGALRVSTPAATASSFIVALQCLTVAGGQVLDYGGHYRFESGHAANLKGTVGVIWFTDATCTVGPSGGPETNTVTDLADTWLPIHADNVVVPPGTGSVLLRVRIGAVTGESVGWFDDVYLGLDPTPVTLESFVVE
jgi:hypothetical protein